MKQNSSRSSHKFLSWILISSVCCLIVGIIACAGLAGIVFPAETRAPETFPNAEIVFVATGRKIGFVNADGSNPQYVYFVAKAYGTTSTVWPWRPVMTGDNQSLIVKMSDHVGNVFGPHFLVLSRNGALPVLCEQWGEQHMAVLSSDQRHLFVYTKQGLALYSLDSCGTDDGPIKVFSNVIGIPSPDLHYVAYTNRPSAEPDDNRFIVVRDMTNNGEEQTIGVGDFPTWSQDSQWLAYTGQDGIYVVNVVKSTKPRLVVLYPNAYHTGSPTYSAWNYNQSTPEVSWSPDGKWLVYHKWTGTDYNTAPDPYDNAIYKVNVETGKETKIIDHGMDPYWRWPATP